MLKNILSKVIQKFLGVAPVNNNVESDKPGNPETIRPTHLTPIREDFIQPMKAEVVTPGEAQPPASTRVTMYYNPETFDRLNDLKDKTGSLSVGHLFMEAGGFFDWAVEMSMQGREIGSIATDEGTIIAAIDPKDGTYVKANMQVLENARHGGLAVPPAPAA